LLEQSPVDAVVVATPSSSHAELALGALDAGKHVFVEKPMATAFSDAFAVHARVRAKGRKLMVGHVLEYHPSIVRLEQLIRSGALGVPRFVCSERFGLAPSSDADVWWELAPHDFSLLRFLTGQEPEIVGARRVAADAIDAFVTLSDGSTARIAVGRAEQRRKSRLTMVVGTESVAVFDGLAGGGNLELMCPRAGLEAWTKALANGPGALDLRRELALANLSSVCCLKADTSIEPLAIEARHFVAAILDSAELRTDADNGLRVVAALDAGERSMLQGGLPIALRRNFATRRLASEQPESAAEL
jgi:UDP-2-acetamido-3-amino-2,3-dideoxy-glucuronate N-acetyltransferase